jgi:membrane peptidoglycan carboxypeptidase
LFYFQTKNYLCAFTWSSFAELNSSLVSAQVKNTLALPENYFLGAKEFSPQEPAMMTNCAANEGFEISPRFRRTVEERIARLEKDAAFDETQVALLENGDHIRRHMRLVAMQRAEALRMRLFLDRARPRLPRPLISL